MEKRLEKWIDDMENIPDELRNDKNFISVVTNEAFYNFRYASDKLKNDKEYVMNLLKQVPDIFEHISEDLRSDKDFIKELFNTDIKLYGIINYVSDKLKDDKEIALLALKDTSSNISYLSDRLKDDIELARIVVNDSYWNFNNISERLQNDKSFVLEFLKDSPSLFSNLSEKLRDDKELTLIAVSLDGLNLEDASKRLQSDKDVVVAAYNENSDSLNYASEELMLDNNLFPDGEEITFLKRIENRIIKVLSENGFTEEFTDKEVIGNINIEEDSIRIQHATGRLVFALFDNEDLEKLSKTFSNKVKERIVEDMEEEEFRAYPSYNYEVESEDEDEDDDEDEIYDNLDEILERGSYNSKKSYASLLYEEDYVSVEDIAWGEFENPVAHEATELFKSMVILNEEQAKDREYPKLKHIVLTEEFPELIEERG